MAQVIEGKAEIVINETPFILNPGETIIMPAGIPHAVNALEKFKMVLMATPLLLESLVQV